MCCLIVKFRRRRNTRRERERERAQEEDKSNFFFLFHAPPLFPSLSVASVTQLRQEKGCCCKARVSEFTVFSSRLCRVKVVDDNLPAGSHLGVCGGHFLIAEGVHSDATSPVSLSHLFLFRTCKLINFDVSPLLWHLCPNEAAWMLRSKRRQSGTGLCGLGSWWKEFHTCFLVFPQPLLSPLSYLAQQDRTHSVILPQPFWKITLRSASEKLLGYLVSELLFFPSISPAINENAVQTRLSCFMSSGYALSDW